MHIITELQFKCRRGFGAERLLSSRCDGNLRDERRRVDLAGVDARRLIVKSSSMNLFFLQTVSAHDGAQSASCAPPPPPPRRKTTGSYRNVVLLIKKEQRTALTLFLPTAFPVVLLIQRCSSSWGGSFGCLGGGVDDVTSQGLTQLAASSEKG